MLPLGGRRQRALLALLLLEPGRSVPADRLADALWQGAPPKGAASTLRSYVSRLRSALGPTAALTNGASGYALAVPPDQVDVGLFERLTREGQEALGRGSARRASERLSEALALWRGSPFADLGHDGVLRLEAERLEQLRILAVEERIEADLALGRASELVDELETLVREEPYRERLWRQLMLALYRVGRQADALAAYRRACSLLDEELGLEPSEELRRIEQAILRQEVPVVAPQEKRHNLPAPMTSFVGRQAELAEIGRLLEENRLITLTGVGGAGKTRLALESAIHALDDLADGVFFADLSALTDPVLVAREVADVLDIRERPGTSILPILADQLRDSEMLLVLDNCEHLRSASAGLAHELLEACPKLRVLATSREPLGVPGEVDFSVPPLGLPPAEPDVESARSSEAVSLFLARAQAAHPRLVDDEEALMSAARICRDLDGLPLAIELSAARAKVLSLDEIAERLDNRFRFLVSWRRLTPARHRTLKGAIDWSYELLAPEEQDLLARVSVFAGGFTLAAAASVCLDDDDANALALIQRLTDASLVTADHREAETRYRLLETIREYAAERLEEAGDEVSLRRAHVAWFLELAERAAPELTGENQASWFAILEAEHDNLRSALAYLGDSEEPELRLRLTIALTRFWYVRGYLTEARSWLEQALETDNEQPVDLRRRALTAAGAIALLQGDYAVATAFAEQSLDAAREGGNGVYVANALSNLGAIVLAAGDHDRAGALLEEAVALAREVGDERIAALAINNLGDQALTVGDYARAEPLFEESLELLRARGDTANVARSLFNLGAVALMTMRLVEADARLSESVVLSRQLEDKEDLAWCLEGFAGLAAARQEGERAAVLLAAADTLLSEIGADFKPFERQLHDSTEASARDLCSEEVFAEATRKGAAMTLDQALDCAAGGTT